MNPHSIPGPGDYLAAPYYADPADPRHDTDHDDELATLAAHYWDKDVGTPVRPERFREALSEVVGAMDDDEARQLCALMEADTAELGYVIAEMVCSYLAADCNEKARQALDELERDAEAEAAAEQMES